MIPLFIAQIKNLDAYIDRFVDHVVVFIPNLIVAVVILVAGIVGIKIFRKIMTRLMTSREMDPTFLKFVLDVCTWIFRVVLIISIFDQLGVVTTSLMALLGTIGIAVGLSLQGSLSNFAGGLLIILFKPFRVGDYIEAQGQAGTVNSIQIFSTRIITSTNQVVYLPNGTLSNNTIKNFSQEPLRRADILIGVGYNSNLSQVKDVIYRVMKSDPKVLSSPAPAVEVKDLAENAITLNIMMWSERGNHGAVVSDFYESIKEAFEKEGIELPFPQRDIHIIGGDKVKALLQ
ncbi:mechanosensitive ion channel [Flavobacterium sp. DG1-102-2]|uniref:mechanosensitive ion channel family protein n=1 Tax=Flavobacterium sp. DG1-102-2 TaxID=3081663 RepID=UPI0029496FB0|nr:mechanosensitive ion channel domain-containing protein [Flavobacterium sp. DG1-102-2]MDV6170263.1 mechanosensitive ion channel [Flavobacterium sp. DG1-102-2]